MSAAPDDPRLRRRVCAEAARFLGTPYRHQGSRRGIGCDCLGLLRGVWREIYGVEAEEPAAYAPDWDERAAGEPMLAAARRHLREIPAAAALPGDVLIFRWRAGAVAKHCGILADEARLIHAYEGAAVLASPLVPAWRRRIAGAFRFPPATGA